MRTEERVVVEEGIGKPDVTSTGRRVDAISEGRDSIHTVSGV